MMLLRKCRVKIVLLLPETIQSMTTREPSEGGIILLQTAIKLIAYYSNVPYTVKGRSITSEIPCKTIMGCYKRCARTYASFI
jgi:hypothetical protein